MSGSEEVTWAALRSHDSEDDLWVAIGGQAYDLTRWVKRHPGGALVLMHAAGKDATHAFMAYHPSWVVARLSSFRCGKMETKERARKAERVFAALKTEVESAGLMEPRRAPYLVLAGFLAATLAAAIWAANCGWIVVSALLVALFWQQVAFIGHDAGHNAITHSRKADSAIGVLVNAAVGIGFSWWKSTHNVHHTVVNTIECDPDIQFMPLVAIKEDFFEPVWSSYHQDWLIFDSLARSLISWQHLTFIPLLMIAKFGLYLQTVKQLLNGKAYVHRGLEALASAVFLAWYSALVMVFEKPWERALFVALSHAAFFMLHLQICLSHFACPTTRELPAASQDWMTHQVIGTMNWTCPPWLDWFHGGLQFQIEHHCFPRMPRHNLRAASVLVMRACQEAGLPYHAPSFVQAVVETLQVLHKAALKARRERIVERGPLQEPPVQLLSRAFI